jgi:uncharacterized protein (TIGR02145 family)
MYPYSIEILTDNITIFTAWVEGNKRAGLLKEEEHRSKLTDEQYLKIKNMVSALKREYEKQKVIVYDARTCILKIDNQVCYEYEPCDDNPEFSHPRFPPIPKEILVLFQYLVDLPPVKTAKQRQMEYNPPPPLVHQKGTFIDTRDGKTYKTTKIGEQVWMAENLNYEASGSKCHDNKPANCKKYGRLYNWNTAIKACPSGWHLPSEEEWEVLTDTIEAIGGAGTAGKYLKSTSGWNSDSYNGRKYSGNGEDKYDFSALSGGFGKSDGYFSIGDDGHWWSASGYTDKKTAITFRYASKDANYSLYEKHFRFSVRCLQD